jgi:hypothetical protein
VSTPPSPGFQFWIAVLAALLGVVLALPRSSYRPVAGFLCTMAALDLVRMYLRSAFDLGSLGPYEGARRLAFHADELGFLAWPAGLAALALIVFGHRRPWPAFAVWGAVGAALVALYPSDLVRSAGLQRVYLVAYVMGFAAVAAQGVAWWNAKRDKPGPESAVLLLLGLVDLAGLVAFYGSVFDRWAVYVVPVNIVLYLVISAVEGGFLWQSWSRSH